LTRRGAKKRPFYRIVVTERDAKRDGRFVEIVGHYDPIAVPAAVKVDRERYDYWISRGAKPTDTVLRCVRAQEKAAAATS
jgi:small subunit ribosomal protein S16